MAEELEIAARETVDAEAPAPDVGRAVSVRRGLAPTTVQAAVAATGVAAGVATVAVVRRRRRRRLRRGRRAALAQVVATRSFLVDVHVLADRAR
jgi:hypothetical protein